MREYLKETWQLWLGVAIFAFMLAFMAAVFPMPLRAHEAPSGWSYPWQCCSNQDCRPVACDTLEEIEGGKVRDIENGQTYERNMVQSSGDAKCHVCTEQGKLDGKGLCVFVQHGS